MRPRFEFEVSPLTGLCSLEMGIRDRYDLAVSWRHFIGTFSKNITVICIVF